jgi:hypothetical protein
MFFITSVWRNVKNARKIPGKNERGIVTVTNGLLRRGLFIK